MNLSPSERERVVEIPVAQERASAEDLSEEEYERAWREELRERLAAVDRGEFADGDWRDVMARIRERSRRRDA